MNDWVEFVVRSMIDVVGLLMRISTMIGFYDEDDGNHHRRVFGMETDHMDDMNYLDIK